MGIVSEYNGYQINVQVEEHEGYWHGHYLLRLNGQAVRIENHLYVPGPRVKAEQVTLELAETYADQHRESVALH